MTDLIEYERDYILSDEEIFGLEKGYLFRDVTLTDEEIIQGLETGDGADLGIWHGVNAEVRAMIFEAVAEKVRVYKRLPPYVRLKSLSGQDTSIISVSGKGWKWTHVEIIWDILEKHCKEVDYDDFELPNWRLNIPIDIRYITFGVRPSYLTDKIGWTDKRLARLCIK